MIKKVVTVSIICVVLYFSHTHRRWEGEGAGGGRRKHEVGGRRRRRREEKLKL
jgi:hypothetical protein